MARHVMSPEEMEAYNPNYVGGDIGGGLNNFGQLFTRPTFGLDPLQTAGGWIVYMLGINTARRRCSWMCGFHAAKSVLREFNITI